MEKVKKQLQDLAKNVSLSDRNFLWPHNEAIKLSDEEK